MPKYDYKCKCGKSYTIEKPMKEATKAEHCEDCKEQLNRVFNPTPNKWNCGGAYVTDSR